MTDWKAVFGGMTFDADKVNAEFERLAREMCQRCGGSGYSKCCPWNCNGGVCRECGGTGKNPK